MTQTVQRFAPFLEPAPFAKRRISFRMVRKPGGIPDEINYSEPHLSAGPAGVGELANVAAVEEVKKAYSMFIDIFGDPKLFCRVQAIFQIQFRTSSWHGFVMDNNVYLQLQSSMKCYTSSSEFSQKIVAILELFEQLGFENIVVAVAKNAEIEFTMKTFMYAGFCLTGSRPSFVLLTAKL